MSVILKWDNFACQGHILCSQWGVEALLVYRGWRSVPHHKNYLVQNVNSQYYQGWETLSLIKTVFPSNIFLNILKNSRMKQTFSWFYRSDLPIQVKSPLWYIPFVTCQLISQPWFGAHQPPVQTLIQHRMSFSCSK